MSPGGREMAPSGGEWEDTGPGLLTNRHSHKLTCLSSVLIMIRSDPRSLQYCLLSDQFFNSVDMKNKTEPHRNMYFIKLC